MKEIILLAEKDLISPRVFYNLCQQYRCLNKVNKLYFLTDNLKNVLNKPKNNLYYLSFFDYLAQKIQNNCHYESKFHVRKVFIFNQKKFKKVLQIKQTTNNKINNINNYDQISLKIIGEGMIGRVAKLNINGKNWAFKSYFYPDFIWLHGPWGEIPVGIYLKAHFVTKNFVEFYLGGETWSIWEWIDHNTNINQRKGITYEKFAQEKGLTKLNYLNGNNYNSYKIRLDAGGVQKKYFGRLLIDFINGIFFYLMKTKHEGILSICKYINQDNFIYVIKRFKSLFYHYQIKRN